jgi:DNA modification methylase
MKDGNNLVVPCLERCLKAARKRVVYFVNHKSFNALTPGRLRKYETWGWGITHLSIWDVPKWSGRYYLVVWEKHKPSIVEVFPANSKPAPTLKQQTQPALKHDLLPFSKAKPVAANSVNEGDCRELIPRLPDDSVHLCLTSPPYAEQRKGKYPGVPEQEYPQFTVDWMAKQWDKLTDDGSVMIIIDPHVKKGVMSDYVRRTEDALCEFGWKQHQTQIWYKRDRAPLGNKDWPRHCWESILWFSKTAKPFCDPKACGHPSDRLSIECIRNSRWTPGGEEDKSGTARVPDVWNVPVGGNEKGINHPAMFPVELAEQLIATFCPACGTVLDPFAGSGSTLIAAKNLGCDYYGFDKVADYCEIARKRLAATIRGSNVSDAG